MTSPLAGLGRLRQWDRRNLDFRLPQLSTDRIRRMWNGGDVLDQLDTPQCVGFTGYGWLQGGPVVNRKLPFQPVELYRWAQEMDEWPGTNYEGTSILGLMKALRERGYITEYRWALDAETVVAWVLERGPVCVGTDWHLEMFMPDAKGFIEPIGEVVGGHAWRIVGVDKSERCSDGTTGAVRMVNSWGRGWGQNGRAWVSIAHLDYLIKHNGEAATAVEIRLR